MSEEYESQIAQLVAELTHETFPKSTREVISLLHSKNIYSDSEANNFSIVWEGMKVIWIIFRSIAVRYIKYVYD